MRNFVIKFQLTEVSIANIRYFVNFFCLCPTCHYYALLKRFLINMMNDRITAYICTQSLESPEQKSLFETTPLGEDKKKNPPKRILRLIFFKNQVTILFSDAQEENPEQMRWPLISTLYITRLSRYMRDVKKKRKNERRVIESSVDKGNPTICK